MITPDPISASLSLTAALTKFAFREYLRGKDARRELRRATAGLSAAQKRGFRAWLEGPSTQHQVESDDAALRAAAQESLAAAIAAAGGDVPSHLGTYVSGAKSIFDAWKRPRELARDTHDIIRNELRSLAEQIELGTVDVTSDIVPLPSAVKALLGRAADVAEMRQVGQHLLSRPSRGGLATAHLVVADPNVAEAVGLYADLRGFYREAAVWHEAAAGRAAQPERLTLRAAFFRHRSGDAERARELVDQIPPDAAEGQLGTAIRSFVSGEDYAPSCDEIDWQDRDIDIVAALAVSGHQAATRDEACRIADEWVRHHRDSKSLAACASAYLSRALTESPRSQLVTRSLELALEAREVSHAAGMPAADSTQAAVFALVDLARVEEIPDVYQASMEAGWRDDDFSDPETAALIRLASEVSGDDVRLNVSLSPFHKKYFEVMGPVLSRDALVDSVSRNDLEDLLRLASSDAERSRALLALAHVGHLDEDGLEQLTASHPVQAAVIRSSHLLATGDPVTAASLIRPHVRDSAEAANQLCFILNESGNDEDRIAAALDGWSNHADIVFFQQAADRIASTMPPAADAVQRLNQAAPRALETLSRTDRQAAYEHLIVANLNSNNTAAALDYAKSFHSEADTEHTRWRLALCLALAGEYDRAWKVISSRHRQPLLVPRDDVERRLLATLVSQFADRPDQVRALLAAREADDTEVEGFCILACQIVATRLEDGAVGSEVQEAISAFVAANPDSKVIKEVSIDLDDPVKSLDELVRPRPAARAQFDRAIALGRLPHAYLTALAGRSITALLVQRGPNWLFAATNGVAARARERKHAAEALRSGVVIDPTALHVLAELRRLDSIELIGFLNAAVPTAVAQDASATRADLPGHSIIIPKTGEAGIESIIELTDADRSLQVQRQQTVAELTQSLPKRPVDGELLIAPHQHMNEHGRTAWSAAELARRDNLPLWADDEALRQLMHQRGVASFNTRAMIEVLRAQGHVTGSDAAHAIASLRTAHITDLPVLLPDLIVIAGESRATLEHAAALRLPGWWAAQSNIRIERLATLFATIATRQPEQLVAWFRCACVGATLANEKHAQAVPALLAVVLLVHCPEIRSHVDSLLAEGSQALWPLSADLTVKGLVAALAIFIDPDPTPQEAARQLLAHLPNDSETHRRVTELAVAEKPGEG